MGTDKWLALASDAERLAVEECFAQLKSWGYTHKLAAALREAAAEVEAARREIERLQKILDQQDTDAANDWSA